MEKSNFENEFGADCLDFDNEFEAQFQAQQKRKWASGEYVDHCKGCLGEDCQCCQYNPSLD